MEQSCSFDRDSQQHNQLITAQKHLRLLVTLWLSRSRLLVRRCGPLAKPLDSEGSDQHAQTILHVILPTRYSHTPFPANSDSPVVYLDLLWSHVPSTHHGQEQEQERRVCGSQITLLSKAYHFPALLPPVSSLCSTPDKDRPACYLHTPASIGQLLRSSHVRLRDRQTCPPHMRF